MFTHQLDKSGALYAVSFSEFAERYFLKDFKRKYKGVRWKITEASIFYDLMRIRNKLQYTQQVDELKKIGDKWYFKYDFAIAKSGKSPKAAGNRCICLLDDTQKIITILAIYNKNDLPKNMGESVWVEKIINGSSTYYGSD